VAGRNALLRAALSAGLTLGAALDCGAAAAVASSRHWQIGIERIECDASASLVALGMRLRYLGPKGPVEAPASELVDGERRRYPPRSLVWKGGEKLLAQWLPAGGVRNVQSEDLGAIELKFDARDASGNLALEFGDIKAVALTRRTGTGRTICQSLLKPGQIQAPRVARAAQTGSVKARVYRSAYPCLAQGNLRQVEAEYPPQPARQLLLFGRGYLPSARRIALPAGTAPAQSYAYAGADDLKAIEDAARRALAADFPEYRASLIADGSAAGKRFAFNWGVQKSGSGNDVYSVGIYDVQNCSR
jgi:hypothetical protein